MSQVFRKPTYTGLILNYSAVCPNIWKFGLVKCLLHRAYVVSSSWCNFSKEVDYLRNIFSMNGYPNHIFESCVKQFLNHKCSNEPVERSTKEDVVETMFFIPYIGLPSLIFGRKIKSLFKTFYSIEVRIVYTTFKVKNYFSLKSRTPLPLLSSVVYKFRCLCDANNVYIGKTMRHLATRVKEHEKTQSAIKDHLARCQACSTNYSCNNFSIITTGKNDFEITIKEALHIKNKQPNINKQLCSQGTSFLLNVF